MPRTYDPEFRRRVVELLGAGRPVRVVAEELGLAAATVHRWKAQDLIDRGVKPGLSTIERGEQPTGGRLGRRCIAVQRVTGIVPGRPRASTAAGPKATSSQSASSSSAGGGGPVRGELVDRAG